MALRHLAGLIYDALLRPARFAAFLAGGADHIRRASLALLLWLALSLGALLALAMLLALPLRAVGDGLLSAAVFTLVLTLFALVLSCDPRALLPSTAFWVLRCQIAVAPLVAAMHLLVVGDRLACVPPDYRGLLLTMARGACFGGMLTLILLRQAAHAEAIAVRWLLAASAPLLSALLWYGGASSSIEIRLLAWWLAGLCLGLLRPLSWLWAAGISLGLALSATTPSGLARARRYHPVGLDEVALLPLPGLRWLLIRACDSDLQLGADWLLEVARHAGQRRAARGALHTLLRRPLAHPLLLWLSTRPAGQAWLVELRDQPVRIDPLIAAYAALAEAPDLDSWPAVIMQQLPTLRARQHQPGGATLLALLTASAEILQADRWATAARVLQRVAPPDERALADLRAMLVALQGLVARDEPLLIDDGPPRVPALADDGPEDWPAQLLAAVAEQLQYLLWIEHYKGAWVA